MKINLESLKGLWTKRLVFLYLSIFCFTSFSYTSYWKASEKTFEGNENASWHNERLNVYAYQLLQKGEYQKAEKILLKLAGKMPEAKNHLITLYNKWGEKKNLTNFLNAHFTGMDYHRLNFPINYWIPLAELYLQINDYPNAFLVFEEFSSRNIEIEKWILEEFTVKLKTKMLNEPYYSFLSLADVFTYQKRFKAAERFYINAFAFGDKELVKKKLAILKRFKDEVKIKNSHLKREK